MPSATAVGRSIGARIRIAAPVSKKHPTIRRRILSISRNVILVIPPKAASSNCGSCATVAACENTVLVAIRRNTCPVVRAASFKTLGICLSLISFNTNTATINAYKAEIAPDSVGVQSPV